MKKRSRYRDHLFANGLSRIPLRYRGTVVALVPVVGLIATLTAWSMIRNQALDVMRWINHTQTVISESDRLLITALHAETGVRGYVITGDENFLAPYNTAAQTLPKTANQLLQMIGDNAEQQRRLEEIIRMTEQRFDLLERSIAQRQQVGRSPFVPDNRLPRQGKAIMDKMLLQLTEFQQVERQLLTERQQRLEDIRQLITRTVWTFGGVSLLSSLIAIAMFNRVDWELDEQELQLKQGQSLLQGIVANVVDGILTLNPVGTIETFNAAAAAMFGYEPEAMLGQPLSALLVDWTNDKPEGPPTDEQGITPVQRQQMMGQRKDGEQFPIDISISDTALGNQSIAVIRDITEVKRTEASLKMRATELAQLNLVLAKTNTDLHNRNRELDQFAYVASHDLKAPLRAIANLSEWLEEDLKNSLPAENQHQIRLLRGRVHRMEALINGLLQYSRIGRTQLPIEPVNVTDLLNEVVDFLDPPSAFKVEILLSPMPTIETKRLLLHQVFANLIGNAIRHHPREDGEAKISVLDQGDRYRFFIADNGIGIAPEYHEKVFTIFQTLESRDKVENTGIGLAIVKKIVESEGGEIQVKSDVGQGTTFEFTWLKNSLAPPV